MKSTREVSTKQEKAIAKKLSARRTSNSGATKFYKGDLTIGADWLLEAKTCMQEKKSFSIKHDWLKKLKEEQYGMHKLYSSLCFDFGGDSDRYYILDEATFMYIVDLVKKDNETI